MSKTIVSVSKKNNSVWRMYFYDTNEDNEWSFQSKKINRLLVWFYKLQKQRLCNDICMVCGGEYQFYKKRFEGTPDICYECEPDEY
jgi:hypothetical protein